MRTHQEIIATVEAPAPVPTNFADRLFDHVESGSTVILVVLGAMLWVFRDSLTKAVNSYVEANQAIVDAISDMKHWRNSDDVFREHTTDTLTAISKGLDRIENKLDGR